MEIVDFVMSVLLSILVWFGIFSVLIFVVGIVDYIIHTDIKSHKSALTLIAFFVSIISLYLTLYIIWQ